MDQLIEAKHLCREYRMGNSAITAVNDLSFGIRQGEFVSIIGRSGSGKSTLLNLLGGLDTPTSGQILFNGKDLRQMKRAELALHRRYTVGMIFQSFNLVSHATALENVKLSLIFGRFPRRKRTEKAVALLEKVGLGNRLGHKPSELSGGEAQRVAIARALANDPKVLLADEPTGNLDSLTSEEIIGIMKTLNRDTGITVIMVTHDQDLAGTVSNKLIRLKDGKII